MFPPAFLKTQCSFTSPASTERLGQEKELPCPSYLLRSLSRLGDLSGLQSMSQSGNFRPRPAKEDPTRQSGLSITAFFASFQHQYNHCSSLMDRISPPSSATSVLANMGQ